MFSNLVYNNTFTDISFNAIMLFSFLHSLTKPAKLLIPLLEWWLFSLLSIAVAFSAVVLDLAYFLDSECQRPCMEFQTKPHTRIFRPVWSMTIYPPIINTVSYFICPLCVCIQNICACVFYLIKKTVCFFFCSDRFLAS